jgi:putative transcriptional regulator
MNIARLRQEAGLRQVDLARAMGVDRSTIAKWESGLSAPKSVVLPRLADALECNIEKLFELPVEQTAQ